MTPFAPPLDREALRAMYPESDGKPIADNTRQFDWINLLYSNLCSLVAREKAFVAASNLWYPVEGHPKERQDPDVYVAFGRPKGDRGSYMQWLEGGVPLTVVFEILSPLYTKEVMAEKFDFYDRHGVEEYYAYDPDCNELEIYTRDGATLRRCHDIADFVSPRLGIRFEMTETGMTVYHPHGGRFLTFVEAKRLADSHERRANPQLFDENAKRSNEVISRGIRFAELVQRYRRGRATPDEVAEVERLLDAPG